MADVIKAINALVDKVQPNPTNFWDQLGESGGAVVLTITGIGGIVALTSGVKCDASLSSTEQQCCDNHRPVTLLPFLGVCIALTIAALYGVRWGFIGRRLGAMRKKLLKLAKGKDSDSEQTKIDSVRDYLNNLDERKLKRAVSQLYQIWYAAVIQFLCAIVWLGMIIALAASPDWLGPRVAVNHGSLGKYYEYDCSDSCFSKRTPAPAPTPPPTAVVCHLPRESIAVYWIIIIGLTMFFLASIGFVRWINDVRFSNKAYDSTSQADREKYIVDNKKYKLVKYAIGDGRDESLMSILEAAVENSTKQKDQGAQGGGKQNEEPGVVKTSLV